MLLKNTKGTGSTEQTSLDQEKCWLQRYKWKKSLDNRFFRNYCSHRQAFSPAPARAAPRSQAGAAPGATPQAHRGATLRNVKARRAARDLGSRPVRAAGPAAAPKRRSPPARPSPACRRGGTSGPSRRRRLHRRSSRRARGPGKAWREAAGAGPGPALERKPGKSRGVPGRAAPASPPPPPPRQGAGGHGGGGGSRQEPRRRPPPRAPPAAGGARPRRPGGTCQAWGRGAEGRRGGRRAASPGPGRGERPARLRRRSRLCPARLPRGCCGRPAESGGVSQERLSAPAGLAEWQAGLVCLRGLWKNVLLPPRNNVGVFSLSFPFRNLQTCHWYGLATV